MMQGIAESAQLAKTLGFTPTSCGAPGRRPAGGALCQSETGRHRQRAVYPQMQLAHALKDARLALSLAEPHTMPGLENIAELWQQAADADMPERICLRYISGCRRRQKRSFLPTPERSGHSGHLSRRMGHQFESTVR